MTVTVTLDKIIVCCRIRVMVEDSQEMNNAVSLFAINKPALSHVDFHGTPLAKSTVFEEIFVVKAVPLKASLDERGLLTLISDSSCHWQTPI